MDTEFDHPINQHLINQHPDISIYLVGGAVRDELLGRTITEQDYVVVGASPQIMLDTGFTQVGQHFPVFLHPETRSEYALARVEQKSGKGYQGFLVNADAKITLEDDLQRRDLTINAMARDCHGNIIDPFGGMDDLKNKWLRHVSGAFIEDPLRVLRVARFAARYAHLGYQIHPETLSLMTKIASSGELDALTAERVWQETSRALGEDSPQIFIKTLKDSHALRIIMPEVDALFGVPQRKTYHPEIDTGLHTLLSLKQAALHQADTPTRFAVLVHDLGKALTPQKHLPRHHGHEQRGVKPVNELCQRLKVPKQYQHLAVTVCKEHLNCHRALDLKPKTILKLLESIDALRNPKKAIQFTTACLCDAQGRTGMADHPYPQKTYLLNCLNAVLAINADAIDSDVKDALLAANKGKQIGEKIRRLRIQAITDIKQKNHSLPSNS